EMPHSRLLLYRGVLSFLSKVREATGSEATRVHHAARQRGSVAARGACAADERMRRIGALVSLPADDPQAQVRARTRFAAGRAIFWPAAKCARLRVARCEVRYNREKLLLVESGYSLDHQRAPFSRSGPVPEVIELPEHVAR